MGQFLLLRPYIVGFGEKNMNNTVKTSAMILGETGYVHQLGHRLEALLCTLGKTTFKPTYSSGDQHPPRSGFITPVFTMVHMLIVKTSEASGSITSYLVHSYYN